jgi:hypothetical protein
MTLSGQVRSCRPTGLNGRYFCVGSFNIGHPRLQGEIAYNLANGQAPGPEQTNRADL